MLTEYEVLIIEDNPGDARIIEILLNDVAEKHRRDIHFNVRWMNLLETGIQYIKQHHYDLVFLDLSLPDCEGMECIESVVAEARNVPVIVVSGNMNMSLYDDVLDHGAQGYIIKGDLSIDRLELLLKSTIAGF